MKRLYLSAFTVPAGTTQAAPVTQAVPLEDAQLETVRLIVPDGHNGLTGIQVRWGGTEVIPAGAGQFIVANDEVMDIGYDDEITATGLVLAGFNTDIFDHTFYLRWLVADAQAASTVAIGSPQAATAPVADASAVAGLTQADTPDASLPDVGAAFGDTGQAVPDVPLPPDVAGAGGPPPGLVLPQVGT